MRHTVKCFTKIQINNVSLVVSIYQCLCTYQCIPPLGRKWGFTGGIDTKLLSHYGAFDDRSLSAQIFFVVTFLRYVKSCVATGANGRDLTR